MSLEELEKRGFFSKRDHLKQRNDDDGDKISNDDRSIQSLTSSTNIVPNPSCGNTERGMEQQQEEESEGGDGHGNKKARKVGLFVQIYLLLSREMKYMYRDKKQLGSRIILSIMLSLLVGVVFWKVGEANMHTYSVSSVLLLSLRNLKKSVLFMYGQFF